MSRCLSDAAAHLGKRVELGGFVRTRTVGCRILDPVLESVVENVHRVINPMQDLDGGE